VRIGSDFFLYIASQDARYKASFIIFSVRNNISAEHSFHWGLDRCYAPLANHRKRFHSCALFRR